MVFCEEFREIKLTDLRSEVSSLKAQLWRFVQMHAVFSDEKTDLYYSFMKDGKLLNLCIKDVQAGQDVPSITDMYLAAFVFENETRELFGVSMKDIAIDFDGAFYAPADAKPMTFLTPAQAALKKAKAQAAPQKKPQGDALQNKLALIIKTKEGLEGKLASLSEEKIAKIKAALKRLEAEVQASKEAGAASETSSKKTAQAKGDTSALDSLKARDKASDQGKDELVDSELVSLLSLMEEDEANIVKEALDMRGGTYDE